MSELQDTLLRDPRFAALQARDIDPLLAAFWVADHEEGKVFFKEGKHADGAFLILSGEVSVTRKRLSGEELHSMGPGSWFGLVALLDDGRRSATCTAATPVKAAFLSEAAFQLLVQSAMPAAHAVQHAVASQLCSDFRHLQADLVAELDSGG